jgi:hypothetical protein
MTKPDNIATRMRQTSPTKTGTKYYGANLGMDIGQVKDAKRLSQRNPGLSGPLVVHLPVRRDVEDGG